MEFAVKVNSTEEMGRAMAPIWRTATEQLVLEAFDQIRAFRAFLFAKGRIKPGAALTSAMTGGSAVEGLIK